MSYYVNCPRCDEAVEEGTECPFCGDVVNGQNPE